MDPIVSLLNPSSQLSPNSVGAFIVRAAKRLEVWSNSPREPNTLHPTWFVLQRPLAIDKLSCLESDSDPSGEVVEKCGIDGGVPPEYLIDGTWDIRSAIFSLGYTAWIMLCADYPYPKGSVIETMTSRLKDPPIPIRSKRDDCPDSLANVVEKMMAPEPNARYQNPKELLQDMEKVTL